MAATRVTEPVTSRDHTRRRAALTACLVIIVATNASAQSTSERFPSFVYRSLAHYGAPLRSAVGAALFIPTTQWTCGDGLCGSGGIEVQAQAGLGGWRIGSGFSAVAPPFWSDAIVTLIRTRSNSRKASPESTYVGMEGGFAFPLSMWRHTVVSVRPAVGFATRVQGPGTSSNRTIFTWNIGASLMLVNF